jgi:enoyl-CoA hydratase
MLFTGDSISAQEARQLGMVNYVVAGADLASHTEQLAARIAKSPSMGLKLAKESVNQALEAQGQWTAIRAAFGLHQLGHSHNMQVHGRPVDPAGIQIIKDRNAPRAKPPEGCTSPSESDGSHA